MEGLDTTLSAASKVYQRICGIQTKTNRPYRLLITIEDLAKRWGVSIPIVEATRKVTTQRGVR